MKASYFHSNLHIDVACTTVGTHQDCLRERKIKRGFVVYYGAQHNALQFFYRTISPKWQDNFIRINWKGFSGQEDLGKSPLSHLLKNGLFCPCRTRYTVFGAASGLISFLLARTQTSPRSFWIKMESKRSVNIQNFKHLAKDIRNLKEKAPNRKNNGLGFRKKDKR